jgi:ribosome-binding ATPase YchF (GTP1/OBG family)
MLIGLIGKPSSGKSTFFQALTQVPVARAAYPFTTIKPNHGMGFVEVKCPETEFNLNCKPKTGYCKEGRRFVPVELLDVAGLVPGAHAGKGMGNQFLDDLRQADVLIHVVDVSGSANEKGEQVPLGSHDPADDIRFLEKEIDYWVEGILSRNWNKLIRAGRTKKTEEVISEQFAGLGVTNDVINKVLNDLELKDKAMEDWIEDERFQLAQKIRERGKPILIAANKCDLPKGKENFEKLKKEFPDKMIVACSAEAEIALKEATKNGFIEYTPGDKVFRILKELNEQQMGAMDIFKSVLDLFGSTGVQACLQAAVFDFLKYNAAFPVATNKLSDEKGNPLPDCFLMKPGSTALDFAKAVHTDIAEKFIKAIDMRSKKALGAEYEIKNGDVLQIVFRR